MKYLLKNLVIAFLILLTIAGFFAILNTSSEKREVVSLNYLVEQINQEEVAIIIISGNELEIELKNGQYEKASKEREISLTESLQNYNVDPEKLKKVTLEVKEESGAVFWLTNVLPFVLPEGDIHDYRS